VIRHWIGGPTARRHHEEFVRLEGDGRGAEGVADAGALVGGGRCDSRFLEGPETRGLEDDSDRNFHDENGSRELLLGRRELDRIASESQVIVRSAAGEAKREAALDTDVEEGDHRKEEQE
jgi:hypothetical protein